jgi:hypothetical protein
MSFSYVVLLSGLPGLFKAGTFSVIRSYVISCFLQSENSERPLWELQIFFMALSLESSSTISATFHWPKVSHRGHPRFKGRESAQVYESRRHGSWRSPLWRLLTTVEQRFSENFRPS